MGPIKKSIYGQVTLTFVIISILTSCTQPLNADVKIKDNKISRYLVESENYSVTIPLDFADKKETEIKTLYGYALDSKTGDVLISIFNTPTSCSPEILGYPEIMSESSKGDEKTIWGKVYDDRGMGNTPSRDALCGYPQASRECQSIGEGCDDGVGAYAFCSEKENFLGIGEPKRVVICISQQTDDSKMAEEIFKTFKWIK